MNGSTNAPATPSADAKLVAAEVPAGTERSGYLTEETLRAEQLRTQLEARRALRTTK
jgi:hypothetical protein